MRRFAALRRHGFHVQRRPARDPRQWLSGHSSPSTDNARSCDRSLLRRRWALPAAFLRHRLLHFIENTAIGGHDQLALGQAFAAAISWLVEPTASAISTIACGDSGWTSTAASGCRAFIRINARVLNSSCTMHAPASTARLRRSDAERNAQGGGPAPRGSFDQDYPDGQ